MGNADALAASLTKLAPSLLGTGETWRFIPAVAPGDLDRLAGQIIVVEPTFGGKSDNWLSQLPVQHPGARIVLLTGPLNTDSKRLAKWAEDHGIFDVVTGDLARGPGDPPYTFIEALRRARTIRDPAPWREDGAVNDLQLIGPTASMFSPEDPPAAETGNGLQWGSPSASPAAAVLAAPVLSPAPIPSAPSGWSPPGRVSVASTTWAGRRGSVVAVVSPKGGVGKSTIANNVAILLGEQGYRVLVADFDLAGQSSNIFYGPSPGWGLDYLLRGYPLDDAFLDRAIAPGTKHKVDLLRGPSSPSETLPALKAMDPQVWFALVEMLAGRYDYVVVDTPPNWQDSAYLEAAFHTADRVLIVVAPGAFDVGELTRDAPLLTMRYHARPEALRLVGNRYVPALERQVRLESLAKEIAWAAAVQGTLKSIPIAGRIPENYVSFVTSERQGEAAGIADDAWRQIAADITGRSGITPTAVPLKKSTNGLWGAVHRWLRTNR